MSRKVARAVPMGRTWEWVGAGVGTRVSGVAVEGLISGFWNIQDCGTLYLDRNLGLRRRRLVVQWGLRT